MAKAGFTIKKVAEGKAWIGNTRFTEKDGLTIASITIKNTPLYEAGLDIDDKILKLGNQPIKTQKDLNEALSTYKPGDKTTIVYEHRAAEKTAPISIGENPALKVISFESAGMPVTEQAMQFRKKWLGSAQ